MTRDHEACWNHGKTADATALTRVGGRLPAFVYGLNPAATRWASHPLPVPSVTDAVQTTAKSGKPKPKDGLYFRWHICSICGIQAEFPDKGKPVARPGCKAWVSLGRSPGCRRRTFSPHVKGKLGR